MAAPHDDSAGEAEAEAWARARGNGSGDGGAAPTAEAVVLHLGLRADGAERTMRVSGQLSSRFPVLLHRGGRCAERRYPPGRPPASPSQCNVDSRQPPQGPDDDNDEDCEAPRSSAAMLNIFRSIPTQMVGQPPREARPYRALFPLGLLATRLRAGRSLPLPPCGAGAWA